MADWTTVPPKTIQSIVQPHGADVTLEFTSDDATPRTVQKKFAVRHREDLERQAHSFQLRLASNDLLPAEDEAITPKAPDPIDVAIEAANAARRKLRNLKAYQAEVNKPDTATLGSSGITILQVRNALIADAEADISNAARIAVFLEQTQ